MPLYSEHISHMYYGGTPSYTSAPHSYSASPLGMSYSASYLNPGGNYSKHSSLGGYSRSPLPLSSQRWTPSSARNYSPLLSTISERGASGPVRINSPRRLISKRSYVAPTYIRPIHINTADIDVSRDKYSKTVNTPVIPKIPETKPEQIEKVANANVENEIATNGPFMPRVDEKPETGIDSSPGLQRSTIKRGRTVVRLHTVKRKDRDSPRKPTDQDETNNSLEPAINDEPQEQPETVVGWREKLSEDLIYIDKREKKTLGEKLVEKFIVKDRDDETVIKRDSPKSQDLDSTLPITTLSTTSSSRSPDRRCSMEMLAEQANLLDSLIRSENLSTTILDLTKLGPENNSGISTYAKKSLKRTNSIDKNNDLQKTKSDHSLHDRLKTSRGSMEKQLSKHRSLKKSSSGSSIGRLDSITEFPKELKLINLPVIEETRDSLKDDSKPKLSSNPNITGTIEVTSPKSPIKFKVDKVEIEEKPTVPKKEILFFSSIDQDSKRLKINDQDSSNIRHSLNQKSNAIQMAPPSPEPEDGNFWDKIGKRETVYLVKRKQILDDELQKQRKALFWFPEDENVCSSQIIESEDTQKNHLTEGLQNNENVNNDSAIQIQNSEILNKTESLASKLIPNNEAVSSNEVKQKTDSSKSVADQKESLPSILPSCSYKIEDPAKDKEAEACQTTEIIPCNNVTEIVDNVKAKNIEPLEQKSVSKDNSVESLKKNKIGKILKKHKKVEGCKSTSDKTKKNVSPEGCVDTKSASEKKPGKKIIKIVKVKETKQKCPLVENKQCSKKKQNLPQEIKCEKEALLFKTTNDSSVVDIKTSIIKKECLEQIKTLENVSEADKCISCKEEQKDDATIPSTDVLNTPETEPPKNDIPENESSLNKTAYVPEEKKPESSVNVKLDSQPAEKIKTVITKKPIKDEPAIRPLIATPRPLQKRKPQVINVSSSSDTTSSEESSEEEDVDSDSSEESGQFYECENLPDGRISTGSNDSGFDSSAPASPAGFMRIKKGGDGAGPSAGGAPSGNTTNTADMMEHTLESSTAYDLFRKTGRFTPPATSIPRFRKYNIEDFHFIKVLGKGSFGKVMLAELHDTEYYYAVKCLKKDVVLEDDDVECTLIERKVLALGTNHPYLCHLFATFQTDSHLFFVMEYLNGGDLMFHIQQSGRFPEPRARFYAAEIVSGLKFLHKRGIVYRDLKLDNILLDYEGHVRIADFGMCKLQIFLDKTADTFCGTPDYMAPEIIKGLKYNQTVDWWSFGVLLYEMLIGQSPFSGCDEDELFWSICNEMPSYPRFLSHEALSILTRLLDKDAKSRLGGMDCMHGDVRDQEFFRSVHWDKLERRELDAPFKPKVRHPLDTQYFDRAFTGERARLTAVEPQVLRTMDQEPFRGFSYTNPNATDR